MSLVKITDALDSTATDVAASANAVRQAYELAQSSKMSISLEELTITYDQFPDLCVLYNGEIKAFGSHNGRGYRCWAKSLGDVSNFNNKKLNFLIVTSNDTCRSNIEIVVMNNKILYVIYDFYGYYTGNLATTTNKYFFIEPTACTMGINGLDTTGVKIMVFFVYNNKLYYGFGLNTFSEPGGTTDAEFAFSGLGTNPSPTGYLTITS